MPKRQTRTSAPPYPANARHNARCAPRELLADSSTLLAMRISNLQDLAFPRLETAVTTTERSHPRLHVLAHPRMWSALVAFCVGVAAVVPACGNGGNTEEEPSGPAEEPCAVTSVSLNSAPQQMVVNTAADVSASETHTGNCTNLSPSWSSDNTSFLTVAAKLNGTATITAVATTATPVNVRVTIGSKAASAAITVVGGPARSITLAPLAPTLLLPGSRQMTAELRDVAGAIVTGTITWTSSDESVATVSGGLVTAVAVGTTTITAKYDAVTPILQASTVVTVQRAPAASITVSPSAALLSVNGKQTFAATVKDDAGNTLTGRTIRWQSSAPTVATVDASTGEVVGVALGGPVTIRAIALENLAVAGDATVTVVACANPLVITDAFATDLGTGWTTSSTTSLPTQSNHSQTVSYQSDGGRSDGFRQMAHSMIGVGTFTVYHRRELEYDPAVSGAITSINYSEDQKMFNTPSSVGWGFFVEQGSNRRTKSIGTAVFSNPEWASASIANMKASDFPDINFSAGKIKFGFYRANTSTSGIYTVTHGIDNWRVEVCR
jgi:uncharacterized protein YjdB